MLKVNFPVMFASMRIKEQNYTGHAGGGGFSGFLA